MMVRLFLLIGLLLPLSAGCSLGTPSPGRVPSTDSAPFTHVAKANTSIPTMNVPEKRFTPTPIKSPVVLTQTVEEALETPVSATESLTITIVYDNNPYDERLKAAWGFAALVSYNDHILLFDTGGDGPTLMENMRTLQIDPTQIESVVLSHAHGDHTGGLSALLEYGARPTVYLPPSFLATFKNQVSKTTEVLEVTPGLSITEGVFTTGEMGRTTPEQALVIQTNQGLVIITGCAHPGVVEIVEQAKTLIGGQVRLVLGGFHLGSKSKANIDGILRAFGLLGVEQVAPCHCTGERAIAKFAAEYGENFIQAGVGKVLVLIGGEN